MRVHRRNPAWGTGLALVVALIASACAHAGRAPKRSVSTIDEAERALADNAQQLATLGIGAPAAAPATIEPAEAEAASEAEAPEAEAREAATGGDRQPRLDGAAEDSSQVTSESVESVRPTPPAPEPAGAGTPSLNLSKKRSRRRSRAMAGEPPAGDATGGGSARCTRICAIAESTCELAQQICNLAQAHAGQARYIAACERAGEQCLAASDACEDCG